MAIAAAGKGRFCLTVTIITRDVLAKPAPTSGCIRLGKLIESVAMAQLAANGCGHAIATTNPTIDATIKMRHFHRWQVLKQRRAEIAFTKAGLHKYH